MPPKRDNPDPGFEALLKVFRTLPPGVQAMLVIAAVVGGLIWYAAVAFRRPADHGPATGGPPSTAPVPAGTYQFAFWNVENLFDDRDDKRRTADEGYDNWFASNTADRELKYTHLANTILAMNGGKGPDVLACVEVESVRAGELLRDHLNAKLPAGAPKYDFLAMKELDGGRHIAPCVISRLPLDAARTRLHGRQLRILETHVAANGHDLNLIASHWTSQLPQPDGSHGEKGRMNYATTIHEMVDGWTTANPAADVLVCGDFNDTPDSAPVVNGLQATGDRAAVGNARLLDLLAGKPPEAFGTHFYGGKPLIYDHIAVSGGMLDGRGWGCDPDSVKVVTEGLIRQGATRREPWRFGNQKDTKARGFADHFPVVVNLTVADPVRP